jgi:diaminopimelate epimerase
MIAFKKLHCLGRDFILLDNRDGAFGALQSAEMTRLCARRFGVGASGILRIDRCSEKLIEVSSYNFNGTLAELNVMDVACVAVFAKEQGFMNAATNIEINKQYTLCNIVSNHENMHFVKVQLPDTFSVKRVFQNFMMEREEVQYYMLPTDEVDGVNAEEKGREISFNKRFPKGANVVFYQPHPDFLEIKHYEHQVDQETYANGLCAIGAALSYAQNNPENKCLVRTKGG